MTRQEFLEYCRSTYGTSPSYPFGDWMTSAVLRHAETSKWYAILMRIPRRKLGINSDEEIDAVNLKLPVEMFGSFGAPDGVYPAYHMNKTHWISLILADAEPKTVHFLTHASFEATKGNKKRK